MEIFGQVQNGVVVLDGGIVLPEGSRVSVSVVPQPTESERAKRRVEFPLVRTGTPGTWNLTNERIAEILDQEDAAVMKDMWNVPS
jgi:hypothetical protein